VSHKGTHSHRSRPLPTRHLPARVTTHPADKHHIIPLDVVVQDATEGTTQAEGTAVASTSEETEEVTLVAEKRWQHEPMILLAIDMPLTLVRQATQAGFKIIQLVTLKNLGINIAKIRVEGPEQEKKIRAWLKERGVHFVTYNDFYVLNQGSMLHQFEENFPWGMLGWPYPCPDCGKGIKIGIVDTNVDMDIPVLSSSKVVEHAFTQLTNHVQNRHGTAISAILVGDCNGEFCGLLPEASLYVAVAFKPYKESPKATALSIAKGLDWLLGEGVEVINLSFCGPDNPLLRQAIDRTLKKGIPVVAAAGNYGDKAPKVYPAGYDGVIAVTAVDKFGRPFPEANHGDYISFSDPGVRVPVPDRHDRLHFRSGTSYASAYCTAIVAVLTANSEGPADIAGIVEKMKNDVIDLGRPGKDEIFGWGLARCGEECKTAWK